MGGHAAQSGKDKPEKVEIQAGVVDQGDDSAQNGWNQADREGEGPYGLPPKGNINGHDGSSFCHAKKYRKKKTHGQDQTLFMDNGQRFSRYCSEEETLEKRKNIDQNALSSSFYC
jgi:hypothetical protein